MFIQNKRLILALGACAVAAAVAGCDNSSINVVSDVDEPVAPVDPPAAPVAFAELVANAFMTSTNDTAEPVDINGLDIAIDNNANFQAVIDGGSGV